MRISRTRHLKTNLGNYESFDFGASVTYEHGDLGYTDEDIVEMTQKERNAVRAEIRQMVDDDLDEMLAEEIRGARDVTEADRTMLLRSFAPTKARPTARTRRTRRDADDD